MRPRVHIDGAVWHLDVGSSHPGAGEGPKGPAVRRLKWYVSWVQNVVVLRCQRVIFGKIKLAHIGEALILSEREKGNTEGR